MALLHALRSPGDILLEIGGRARDLRLHKNLSRSSLAEMSGVSTSTIKRFEETGVISLSNLVLLAVPLDATGQLSALFEKPAPVSLKELKAPKRERGRL